VDSWEEIEMTKSRATKKNAVKNKRIENKNKKNIQTKKKCFFCATWKYAHSREIRTQQLNKWCREW